MTGCCEPDRPQLRLGRSTGTTLSGTSDPGNLQPHGLMELQDWTAAAPDRVDREAFFPRFNEGEAVPHFYEPFLEEFDPALRKRLDVWYTPAEVCATWGAASSVP